MTVLVNRLNRLCESFANAFGEDLDDISELFEALITDFPDAEDQEIIDYVVEVVIDNHDEVPRVDDVLADFSCVWGRKV